LQGSQKVPQKSTRTTFPRRSLSATFPRDDDGHLAWLDPYFGGTCFRLGYARAVGDGITARFTVTFVGVRFSVEERSLYDELTDQIEVETDPAKRQALIREALGIHKAEIGNIPLHQAGLAWGVRKGVNVVLRSDDSLELKWVTID